MNEVLDEVEVNITADKIYTTGHLTRVASVYISISHQLDPFLKVPIIQTRLSEYVKTHLFPKKRINLTY